MTKQKCCPACNRSLAKHKGITINVQRGIVIVNGVTAYTDAQGCSLLKFLWASSPNMVSYNDIRKHMWGIYGGPNGYKNVISVVAYRLRKATVHTDLFVKTHPAEGLSCYLADASLRIPLRSPRSASTPAPIPVLQAKGLNGAARA